MQPGDGIALYLSSGHQQSNLGQAKVVTMIIGGAFGETTS